MNESLNAKDLAVVPPRSPKEILGGFAILARTIDKARAHLAGTIGEYTSGCPTDRKLLNWKGITIDEFRDYVATGADDAAIVEWMKTHGEPKTDAEIEEWSTKAIASRPDPGSGYYDWFVERCTALGLDPATATWFDYNDADDRASFPDRTDSGVCVA